jgi:hypothetical protein
MENQVQARQQLLGYPAALWKRYRRDVYYFLHTTPCEYIPHQQIFASFAAWGAAVGMHDQYDLVTCIGFAADRRCDVRHIISPCFRPWSFLVI